MTFVGKILVIVIMAFALLFLGLSTVVFTTHTNWKEAADKANAKVKTANSEKAELSNQLGTANDALKAAKNEFEEKTKIAEKNIADLEEQKKKAEGEVNDLRGKVEVALQSAQTALKEAEDRRVETDALRKQKSDIDKVANDYKLQQTELNDKIRELERMNKTLDDNTKDLRDKVGRFSALLRKNGLSDDITGIKALDTPPTVEGEVARIDATGHVLEITIGSDDGIRAGHELFLFRTKPRPEYLGKVKVLSADPDQAVVRVIGNTIQGKKIQEGDIVSSTIRPRS